MVWGVEMKDHAARSAAAWANAVVLACYLGQGGEGIHLMGPLAGKVLRIAPPLIISAAQSADAMELIFRLFRSALESTIRPD